MVTKSIFVQLSLVCFLVGLTACSNPVAKVAMQNNVLSFVGADSENGGAIVIEPEKALRITECQPREPIDSDSYGKKLRSSLELCDTIVKRVDGSIVLLNVAREEIAEHIVEAIMASHPGSVCTTTYVNGRQFNICK